MEVGVSTVFGHLRRLVMDESAETRGVARPKALGRAAHTGDSRLRNLTLVSEAGSAESRHTLTPRHPWRALDIVSLQADNIVGSEASSVSMGQVEAELKFRPPQLEAVFSIRGSVSNSRQFFQFEAVLVFWAEFFNNSHSQVFYYF